MAFCRSAKGVAELRINRRPRRAKIWRALRRLVNPLQPTTERILDVQTFVPFAERDIP